MKVINGIEGLRGAILTIGNFDGVHKGHQKIISEVTSRARALRRPAVAITFEPHPMKVLYPERGVRMLTTAAEKARVMERFGIDALCFINFDRDFAALSADDFIKSVLVETIGVKEVIVGHNYAFGKGKKGTTALLRRRGAKYGFRVRVVRNARIYGDVVSSSRIRSLLGRGRVCEASLFLGRPFSVHGTVVKGAGRGGSLLGTPTANIAAKGEIIPKEGVYAVKIGIEGKIYGGAANIGRNPTFGGSEQSTEVHIFGFGGDILGRDITLYFIDRIRDEKTFPDKDSLKEQINKDIERSKEILARKKHPPII